MTIPADIIVIQSHRYPDGSRYAQTVILDELPRRGDLIELPDTVEGEPPWGIVALIEWSLTARRPSDERQAVIYVVRVRPDHRLTGDLTGHDYYVRQAAAAVLRES